MSKSWLDKLVRSVEAGRKVNIVHFNVNDEFVHDGEVMKVREIIEKELGMRGYIYASPGSGFTFSDDDTELFFREAAGFPVPPLDPGPMPLEATEAEKERYLEEYAEYQEWLKVAEKYEKAGVNPLRALGQLAPIDTMTLAAKLSQFMSFVPNILEMDEGSEPWDFPRPNEYGVIIEYADAYMTQTDQRGFDQKVLSTALREWSEQHGEQLPVILLAADALADLDKSLYGRGAQTGVVEVPYPDFDERLEYIEAILGSVSVHMADGIKPKDIARATAGLANRHIRAMLTEAFVEDRPLNGEYMRKFKEDTLQAELKGLVEVMCPTHGMDTVGGLVKVKEVLNKVGGYLKADKTTLCPMGILFTGPPGTGKTWVAETWSHDLDYTFIKLGTFRSKWVGESERNLDKVFQIAKALAPVIIFVDEIDQEGQRGGENDGGVGSRVFGAILKFMSDTSLRGKVIWIAATNRPDLMDAAMKRPGRFDIRIPFPFPRQAERQDIFRAIIRKYNLDVDPTVDFARLAEMTDKHSGADIEAICLEAGRVADTSGSEKIQVAHFTRAIDDYMVHHDAKAIRKMEVAAYKECNSKALLPDDVLKEMEKRAATRGAARSTSKEV